MLQLYCLFSFLPTLWNSSSLNFDSPDSQCVDWCEANPSNFERVHFGMRRAKVLFNGRSPIGSVWYRPSFKGYLIARKFSPIAREWRFRWRQMQIWLVASGALCVCVGVFGCVFGPRGDCFEFLIAIIIVNVYISHSSSLSLHRSFTGSDHRTPGSAFGSARGFRFGSAYPLMVYV